MLKISRQLCVPSILRESPGICPLPHRMAKKKATQAVKETTSETTGGDYYDAQYVPVIPSMYVTETTNFFKNKNLIRSLLEFIFSPRNPKDTAADREDYQVAFERYQLLKEKARAKYKLQEQKASENMWKAIGALPSELYDEAVQSDNSILPKELLFHEAYKKLYFNSDEMSPYEMRKLQLFQNLMHVRFPFLEEKKRDPLAFWARQSQSSSRQKEASMLKKTKGKKK